VTGSDSLYELGSFPDIDEIFPPKLGLKQNLCDEPVKSPRLASQLPVPSGAGFFTPEAQNAFRFNVEPKNAFRINGPGHRDSMYVVPWVIYK